jgi:hypothetical protein
MILISILLTSVIISEIVMFKYLLGFYPFIVDRYLNSYIIKIE